MSGFDLHSVEVLLRIGRRNAHEGSGHGQQTSEGSLTHAVLPPSNGGFSWRCVILAARTTARHGIVRVLVGLMVLISVVPALLRAGRERPRGENAT
jgi:hypothetical protein